MWDMREMAWNKAGFTRGWREMKKAENPVRRVFRLCVVARRGFEPLIPWLRTRYPGPLDERATMCGLEASVL